MDDTAIQPIIEAERKRIEAIPIAPSLPVFLEERFATYPDRIALDFFEDGDKLTYGDLGRRARRMADALSQTGVTSETRVAVMAANHITVPVLWCAVALLGATYVPVNARYTETELRYVLGDSGASFLFADEGLVPGPIADVRVIEGSDWQAFEESGSEDWVRTEDISSDQRMSFQYTSGTTGFPKGVVLKQRYWLLMAHVAYHMFPDLPERVLTQQPFFYMDPQWQMLTAFMGGGTFAVARKASSRRFIAWCRDNKLDRALMPEVVFKEPERPDDADNSLKSVWTFGWRGPARAAAEERFGLIARECFGMTEIGFGLYTPAEATHRAGSPSCGVPAPFREAEIRDDAGNPLPTDTVGQLWIKGDGVAAEYWKRPEANAETFVDGWFATGDLFTRDAAGWYRIVGRKKDMIRRSSENIAAREVETALHEMPEIAEAAVLPVPDERRGEEVMAILILAPGVAKADVPPETVIAHCETRLAPFKIPRYIAYADELPRTPGRKIAKHRIFGKDEDRTAKAWDRMTQSG